MTYEEWEKLHGRVSISSEAVQRNPHMDDFQGFHWKCRLRHGGRQLTVYFSKGYGLHGEPTAKEVVTCLGQDAAGLENNPFMEDWLREYGYDEDSARHEKTFRQVERQTEGLKRIMDSYAYEELVWDVEC